MDNRSNKRDKADAEGIKVLAVWKRKVREAALAISALIFESVVVDMDDLPSPLKY